MNTNDEMDSYQILYDFFLQEINKEHFYVPIEKEIFISLLKEYTYVVSSKNRNIDGLLIGSKESTTFYIAYLLGDTHIQKKMLLSLEEQFKNTDIQSIAFSFYNPIKVPFFAYKNNIHVNAQGVREGSLLSSILEELSYQTQAIQDTYHIDINAFNQDDYIEKETLNLKDKGIEFRCEIGTNELIEDFLNRLPNTHFIDAIKRGIESEKPIWYVHYKGSIVGFTGPISVIDSRGSFGGIELLEEARGLGAGKLLFFKLIQSFKSLGAKYTTLFTGRENKAQYIYLSAGATRVQTFIMMKKEL